MQKKFELTSDTKVVLGHTLHRIKSLISFGIVSAGDFGGWIEKEENINHSGDAWVYGDARVYGDAWVSGNAWVSGDACVYGDARVYGDACVYGNAWVSGDARVYGNARVYGDAWVYGVGAIFWIGAVGSRNGTTTFFACKDKKIRVVCGCFFGDLEEFEKAIKSTHSDNQYAKVYLLSIEMAKARIDLGGVNENDFDTRDVD